MATERPVDAAADKPRLSDVPIGRRYFWTESNEAFNALAFDPGVFDRNFDGTLLQKLTPNKVLVLALNELAAHHGRGWFWHLPSRGSVSHEKTQPADRKPEGPGASYPSVVCAPHAWSKTGSDSFFASSQQLRLMASDFYLNCPRQPASSPVHCFQVASHFQAHLYTTPHESRAILLNRQDMFLVPNRDLERIVGPWGRRKKHRPTCAEPERRLDTIPGLWTQPSRDPRCGRLAEFGGLDLEGLYRAIVASLAESPGLTVRQVRRTMPTPRRPSAAIPLGTPLAAPTPSRRGKRNRAPAGEVEEGQRAGPVHMRSLAPSRPGFATSDSNMSGAIKNTTFATFASASADAYNALNHLRNRRHHELLCDRGGSSLRLDLNAMLGKHCLSFGSSRLNDVQLAVDSVCPRHFLIFLEPSTQQLFIKDVSTSGTTILGPDPVLLPRRKPVPLTSSVTIVPGARSAIRFHVSVPSLRRPSWFLASAAYGASLSAFGSPPRQSRHPTPPSNPERTASEEEDSCFLDMLPGFQAGEGAGGGFTVATAAPIRSVPQDSLFSHFHAVCTVVTSAGSVSVREVAKDSEPSVDVL
ncbi:hypothetical protein DM02DRAFT_654776 [Periconia macrospinosa]|uniref:FHA domain-containing protein n=1 Tax=Periconia macrospinosa TaxID=97972 RepID=A0A2V1DWB4_9PLEO|nr:hypothetical protein DM02DRAFT_654776 [Periconia macrospinosa]